MTKDFLSTFQNKARPAEYLHHGSECLLWQLGVHEYRISEPIGKRLE